MLLDRRLQPVEHLKVRLIEDVGLRVHVRLGARRQPEGVDAEERPELVDKVLLLLVCAGSRRHPQLLWIIRNLEIHEAHRAEGEEDDANEHKKERMTASRQAEVEG